MKKQIEIYKRLHGQQTGASMNFKQAKELYLETCNAEGVDPHNLKKSDGHSRGLNGFQFEVDNKIVCLIFNVNSCLVGQRLRDHLFYQAQIKQARRDDWTTNILPALTKSFTRR